MVQACRVDDDDGRTTARAEVKRFLADPTLDFGERALYAIDPDFELDKLPSNSVVRQVLDEADLDDDLFAMGKEVAATTIELFGDRIIPKLQSADAAAA